MTHESIAWIIPCHNEAVTIATVVADIKRHCPGAAIYVYDNVSTDGTAAIAAEAGATVRFEPMKGKGNVVRRMFQEVEADIVFMIDGDGTYDVSAWNRLAAPIRAGEADMVVGRRLGTTAAFRRFHAFGNGLITQTVRTLFGVGVTDVLSGYRAFSRRFVRAVAIESFGFEIESELTAKAMEHRFPIVEVETPYGERPKGSKSKLNTFRDGAIILTVLVGLFKDYKPLTFCGLIAILAAISGGVALALSRPFAAVGLFGIVPSAVFGGLILNAVSQRSKELNQIIVKLADADRKIAALERQERDSHAA